MVNGEWKSGGNREKEMGNHGLAVKSLRRAGGGAAISMSDERVGKHIHYGWEALGRIFRWLPCSFSPVAGLASPPLPIPIDSDRNPTGSACPE